MNERIEKLAEQCRIEEYNEFNDLVEFGFNEEKFAQLLLQECMNITGGCFTRDGIHSLYADEIIAEYFGVNK